jgi:hypothetical protein
MIAASCTHLNSSRRLSGFDSLGLISKKIWSDHLGIGPLARDG